MSDDPVIPGACPVPLSGGPTILLGHGGGGRLMHDLLEGIVRPAFANEALDAQHDGAILDVGGHKLAFSTDSYVVSPLFFPGGDIGSLAVHGTVNDLSMCGARPLYLSAAFIIEEGLPMRDFERLTASMQAAAAAAGAMFVTGDTKVVDSGKGDGLFINTAGIGVIDHDLAIGPGQIQAGDRVVLSGDVGRHGMAIMASREGLSFESTLESDSADVSGLVAQLVASGARVHCLRDCTRGGLATSLIELAETAKRGIHIREQDVPVLEPVRGACEILGLDPLYVACEGRFVALAPADDAERILDIMRGHPLGEGATIIGDVNDEDPGLATLESFVGVTRILDMISGEQLPRIC